MLLIDHQVVKTLNDAVQTIRYDGLDLSRLKVVSTD
jgi:hypothetical protein